MPVARCIDCSAEVAMICRMAQTGDECEKSGLYLASGGCGHAAQRTIVKGHKFPVCYDCGMQTHWTLVREWLVSDDEPDEQP